MSAAACQAQLEERERAEIEVSLSNHRNTTHPLGFAQGGVDARLAHRRAAEQALSCRMIALASSTRS